MINADAFVEYLKDWAGVPLAAVHEYDLRLFLFDVYPRKRSTTLRPSGAKRSTFAGAMGLTEAGLDRALQRLWLLWRDDLIRSGEVVPAHVRALLVEQQRDGERTPHPDLDGESPLEAIEAERARLAGRG